MKIIWTISNVSKWLSNYIKLGTRACSTIIRVVHHSDTVQAKQIRIAYVQLTSMGRFTYINTLQWLHDFALRTISEPKDGLCRAQTLSFANRMTKLFWSTNNHFVEKDRLKSIDSFLSSRKRQDSKFRQIVTSTKIQIIFTHYIL